MYYATKTQIKKELFTTNNTSTFNIDKHYILSIITREKMSTILKILSDHKHAIIWTCLYVLITWAILYFLFNFSIFNAAQWHRLAHARLHGFAGFVFGILILAALPLYAATTVLIIRTKKPLVEIPLPQIKLASPAPSPEPEKSASTTITTKTEQKPELPPELPREMHSQFLRARHRLELAQTDTTPSAQAPSAPTTPAAVTDIPNSIDIAPDEFPLPTDFDTPSDLIPEFTPLSGDAIPTFTDISFDAPDTPQETVSAPQMPSNNMTKYLSAQGINFTIENNIIITPSAAIAVHDDNEFWVCDSDNWFATGQVRPSPIIAVKLAAQRHNCQPVLYLVTSNIMDLDTLIGQWSSEGIKIITKPSDL